MGEGLLLGRPSKQRPPELFIISIDSLEGAVNDLRVPLYTALSGYSSFRVMGRVGMPKKKSVLKNNNPHFVATNHTHQDR
jgi:hypothetical protein